MCVNFFVQIFSKTVIFQIFFKIRPKKLKKIKISKLSPIYGYNIIPQKLPKYRQIGSPTKNGALNVFEKRVKIKVGFSDYPSLIFETPACGPRNWRIWGGTQI